MRDKNLFCLLVGPQGTNGKQKKMDDNVRASDLAVKLRTGFCPTA